MQLITPHHSRIYNQPSEINNVFLLLFETCASILKQSEIKKKMHVYTCACMCLKSTELIYNIAIGQQIFTNKMHMYNQFHDYYLQQSIEVLGNECPWGCL